MKKILFALTMMASALALAAEPLGMVIDVQGGATVNDGGKTKQLDMLSYLNAQNEIQLPPGASMTATWYAGSKELKFSGPARLKVESAGIKVMQGGAAQERPVADEKMAATKKLPPRLGQAAISMRGIKPPLTPEQEAQREKLRPAENAPFGDWVVYAMGLEQMGLTSEAKGVWKKLSVQRPTDPKLRQLAE
jgi:hypothetical protein